MNPEQPVPAGGYNPNSVGRTKAGWLLFKESLKVLKSDDTLFRYVIVSSLFNLLVLIVFGVIGVLGHKELFRTTTNANNQSTAVPTVLGVVYILVYYILAYFIVNLYSAGLAINVLDLYQGKKQSYGAYMKHARSRGWPIFVFSVIEATVGMILRAIAERSKLIGKIIVSIIGTAWSIARLFVVPIIVSTDEGAVPAIKDSTKLLIATWGENIVGRVSMSIVIFVLILIMVPVSILLVFAGVAIGHAIDGNAGTGPGILVSCALIVLLFVIASVIIAAANNVLNVTLYYYAKTKHIPQAYNPEVLNSVFTHKKSKASNIF